MVKRIYYEVESFLGTKSLRIYFTHKKYNRSLLDFQKISANTKDGKRSLIKEIFKFKKVEIMRE